MPVKNESRPSIDCPHCDGSGKIKLSAGSLRTLEILRKLGPSTAVALNHHRSFSELTPTALNNRLEYLRANALVSRHRSGRTWVYAVV